MTEDRIAKLTQLIDENKGRKVFVFSDNPDGLENHFEGDFVPSDRYEELKNSDVIIIDCGGSEFKKWVKVDMNTPI